MMKPDHLCRHFRTKKLYVPALQDEVFAAFHNEAEHCGHCWCNRTLSEVGMDDKLADLHACNPARPCFEE